MIKRSRHRTLHRDAGPGRELPTVSERILSGILDILVRLSQQLSRWLAATVALCSWPINYLFYYLLFSTINERDKETLSWSWSSLMAYRIPQLISINQQLFLLICRPITLRFSIFPHFHNPSITSSWTRNLLVVPVSHHCMDRSTRHGIIA